MLEQDISVVAVKATYLYDAEDCGSSDDWPRVGEDVDVG